MESTFATAGLNVAWTQDDKGSDLTFDGQLKQGVELVEFAKQFEQRVSIDLEKVSFINSIGMREWVLLLRSLFERDVQVTLQRCSPVMVRQMSMIVEAKGAAEVESFFAPYRCEPCGYESPTCIQVAGHLEQLQEGRPPVAKCPECHESMQFVESPERYLLFLEDVEAQR